MSSTKITPQMCATGSYLIHKGKPGGVQTVWHVTLDGNYLSTHATRQEARQAAAEAREMVPPATQETTT